MKCVKPCSIKCQTAMYAIQQISASLPYSVKLQYNTELMRCDAKEVELSRTLSSSSHKIKNLATILYLCMMKSHCIPINLPSCEDLTNLYLKGVPSPDKSYC